VRPAGILLGVFFVQRSFSGATPLTKHFGRLCSWSMVIQHQSRFASFQHGTLPVAVINRIDEPMRETSTGVANPAVIDLFGVDQKREVCW